MNYYELSQVFNIASKIIALAINFAIMRFQIQEIFITKRAVPYVAWILFLMNLLVCVTVLVSFVLVYIRTHYAVDPIWFFTHANYISVIYLLYSFMWLVLYRNYYLKK